MKNARNEVGYLRVSKEYESRPHWRDLLRDYSQDFRNRKTKQRNELKEFLEHKPEEQVKEALQK